MRLLHVSRAREKAISLVEVMVTLLILMIILSGLFIALRVSDISFCSSTEKMQLQDTARLIMDMITKDVRQTASWDIANNNPSSSYIKFRKVTGTDTTTGQYIMSTDYTEYIYNADTDTLTRNILDSVGAITETKAYTNIISDPFFTVDSTDAVVVLNSSDLIISRRLIIDLQLQKQVKISLNVPYSLTTEVKVRNE